MDDLNKLVDLLFRKIIESKSFQNNADNLVLVGGLALGYWLSRFDENLKALDDEIRIAVESDDIDFIGSKEASQLIYDELLSILDNDPQMSSAFESIAFAEPDPFSSTPNTSIISIKAKAFQDPIIVDFLGNIVGMDKKALKNPPKVQDDSVSLRILSPIQIMRSRLANLNELGYGADRLDKEIKRIKVCSMLCSEFVKELLDSGEEKSARKAVQEVYEIAGSQYGVKLFVDQGIAVEQHIMTDDRLGKSFIEKELPALQLRLAKSREGLFKRIRNNKPK